MRRMRLGDKSIERDAARIRALLGPGGGGGNDIFCQVMSGYNYTTSTPMFVGADGTWFGGIKLSATGHIGGGGILRIATAGTITLIPIVGLPPTFGTGNIRAAATSATIPNLLPISLQDSIGETTIAVPSTDVITVWAITELAMTLNVAVGDMINVSTRRVGSSGLDNWTGYLDLLGWMIA